ncbi:MAG TPA: YihY/virulence factor BrkB family protein [Thermoanaerobaculia bacterium]|nr:YihY/virulence factor BrkB family protein [Thermoanaerobaculia bacterium]
MKPGGDWKTIAADVWRSVFEERVAMLAAAVAFYSFLSLPPALTLFVSIYGLIAEASDVANVVETFGLLVPGEAEEILVRQLGAIADSPAPTLSLGIAVSLLIGLWSSTRGIRSLIVACNAIDGASPPRGILALNRLALVLTGGLLLFGVVALFLVVLLPAALALLPGPSATGTITALIRWPLLGAGMMFILAVLYAYAPNRTREKIHWGTWGAATATVLWLIASALMSQFVQRFGSYNQTYGALAGVVVLLMWLYLSAWAVLLGAALNAALVRAKSKGAERIELG